MKRALCGSWHFVKNFRIFIFTKLAPGQLPNAESNFEKNGKYYTAAYLLLAFYQLWPVNVPNQRLPIPFLAAGKPYYL